MEKHGYFEIRNISKSFPGVKALSNVSLRVDQGEVKALVGENGAGKSTLMKILNGNYKADSGQILIEGEEVNISNPVKAAEFGISIIFQELNMVDYLSVAENIFLGRLPKTKSGFVDWKKVYRDAKEVLDKISFDIDPKTEVGKLSVAGKQMVEIAKALSHESKIILMDEPSATLTKSELDVLFKIVKDLKKNNISVIYISHRLEEIFEICDSVTILRDGCVVDDKKLNELTQNEIVKKMVGREVSQTFPEREHNIGGEILKVSDLRNRSAKNTINFHLREGEVLGIAGLVGAGRTEAMRALYGVDYIESGEVWIHGKKVNIHSPNDAKKAGIAFITEDRKNEGLVIDLTVKSNIVMANLNKLLNGCFISTKKEKVIADEYIKEVSIKTPSRNQKVENLSGGNQQKVVVAKWLNTDAEIIIMDEPTKGIDVGTKLEIYNLINELVQNGRSVILISSELPEVLGMSDRVLVMKNDSIVAELIGADINAETVMQYAL
jgi:ribose transport system ATP-binding protein